ncbi:MAG: hypothetical protein ACK56I_29925, partial [bacterium]
MWQRTGQVGLREDVGALAGCRADEGRASCVETLRDLSLLDMRYWPAHSGRTTTSQMKPDGSTD